MVSDIAMFCRKDNLATYDRWHLVRVRNSASPVCSKDRVLRVLVGNLVVKYVLQARSHGEQTLFRQSVGKTGDPLPGHPNEIAPLLQRRQLPVPSNGNSCSTVRDDDPMCGRQGSPSTRSSFLLCMLDHSSSWQPWCECCRGILFKPLAMSVPIPH